MKKEILLGDSIYMGGDHRPVIIPEIGINHGGSLDVAKKMVDAAHRAGARLIKHQTHIIEDEMSAYAKQVISGNADISIYDIMKSCALEEEEELELKQYTESLGMLFLSTPFSRAAVDRLLKFNIKAFKIGSGEMNNYPLIEYIASNKKTMIVSTGMNDIKSVWKTVNIMEKYNVPYALMHTTNLYPTKPKQVRLGAMQELMREFPETPIGLSDHTLNNNSAIAAITLGASLIERHFTDHKDRQGPDILCSMDENELASLITASKEIPSMLGGKKMALPEEQVTIDFAFATVVTIRPIKQGETFTENNIWVKRPGVGELSAEEYCNVLGKKATRDIESDVHIMYDMIEE